MKMEEDNSKDLLENSESGEKENKDKAPKQDKPIKKTSWFSKIRAEFSKIVWVSRKELAKQTVTVITVSLIVGAIIFVMDSVFNLGYSQLINLFNKG